MGHAPMSEDLGSTAMSLVVTARLALGIFLPPIVGPLVDRKHGAAATGWRRNPRYQHDAHGGRNTLMAVLRTMGSPLWRYTHKWL